MSTVNSSSQNMSVHKRIEALQKTIKGLEGTIEEKN